jgi:hypothetical protein
VRASSRLSRPAGLQDARPRSGIQAALTETFGDERAEVEARIGPVDLAAEHQCRFWVSR